MGTIWLPEGAHEETSAGTVWVGGGAYGETADAGISGTLSVTLSDATLAATGTLQIAGVVSATLADATLAATGTLTIAGSLNATLEDATLVATGTVPAPASPTVGGDALPWWLNPYLRRQLEERERERKAPRVAVGFVEFPLFGVKGRAQVVPVRGGNLTLPLPQVIGTASRGVAGEGRGEVAVAGSGTADVGAVVKAALAEVRIKGHGRAYLPVEGVASLSLRLEISGRATHWVSAKGRAVLPLPMASGKAEVVRNAAGTAGLPPPGVAIRASTGPTGKGIVAIRPMLSAQVEHDPDDEETLTQVLLLAA